MPGCLSPPWWQLRCGSCSAGCVYCIINFRSLFDSHTQPFSAANRRPVRRQLRSKSGWRPPSAGFRCHGSRRESVVAELCVKRHRAHREINPPCFWPGGAWIRVLRLFATRTQYDQSWSTRRCFGRSNSYSSERSRARGIPALGHSATACFRYAYQHSATGRYDRRKWAFLYPARATLGFGAFSD